MLPTVEWFFRKLLLAPLLMLKPPMETLPWARTQTRRQVAGQVSDVVADFDRIAVCVEAHDRGRAGRWADLVEDRSDHRRLPGAVGSEEPEYLARFHLEVEVLEGGEVPVVLRETVGLDGGVHAEVPFVSSVESVVSRRSASPAIAVRAFSMNSAVKTPSPYNSMIGAR